MLFKTFVFVSLFSLGFFTVMAVTGAKGPSFSSGGAAQPRARFGRLLSDLVRGEIMYFLLSNAWGLIAATEVESSVNLLFQHVVAAMVFSVIGVAVFGLGIWIVAKVMPFSFRKELEEDQNTALAIIVGSMLIGISLIIAAAIQG